MVKTLKNDILKYTGKVQPKPGIINPESGQVLYPYLPSSELVEAVNLAMYLKRPLLIKGEPGCGKTRLASAVAYELGLSYETWYIKSTSRARDGLYTYDNVRRLRDAQLAATEYKSGTKSTIVDNPEIYIKLGPLGRAFKK